MAISKGKSNDIREGTHYVREKRNNIGEKVIMIRTQEGGQSWTDLLSMMKNMMVITIVVIKNWQYQEGRSRNIKGNSNNASDTG